MFAGYLTQAQGLITTDASRASFISTFTVGYNLQRCKLHFSRHVLGSELGGLGSDSSEQVQQNVMPVCQCRYKHY